MLATMPAPRPQDSTASDPNARDPAARDRTARDPTARDPTASDPTARAAVTITGARALYVGPGLDLAPHRNAVATLALALGAPFALALPAEPGVAARSRDARIALIPPGVLHHLRTRGPMAFVYLDALDDDYPALRETDLDAALDDLGAGDDPAATWNAPMLCRRLGVVPRDAGDARIVRVVRGIDAQTLPSLAAASAQAGLSASRFQVLFRRSVGLPFRRYRLWRRMGLAMTLLAQRRSLTAAAHDAGFASSAHFSTAFKAMFGIAPSSLLAMGVRIRNEPRRPLTP
jgi:AraC-like DNA-binding protein